MAIARNKLKLHLKLKSATSTKLLNRPVPHTECTIDKAQNLKYMTPIYPVLLRNDCATKELAISFNENTQY